MDDLPQYLKIARAVAWEERDTGVMDCLLDVRVFTLSPMVAGERDPLLYSGMLLVSYPANKTLGLDLG